MSVEVRLPAALQGYTDGRAEVRVPAAATVGDALARVADQYPRVRPHLWGDDGRLRTFVSVFLNDDDVRHLGGTGAAVADGDVLTLVPSIAGGARRRATREKWRPAAGATLRFTTASTCPATRPARAAGPLPPRLSDR